MNDATFYIFVLILLLAILFLIFINIIRWFRVNDTLIDLSILEDGTFKSKVGRYRIKTVRRRKIIEEIKVFGFLPVRKYETVEKTWLFPMMDFFSKHPFPVDYDRLKRYFVAVESNPIIGVKRIVNIKKLWLPHPTDETAPDMVHFIPWIPIVNEKEKKIAIDDYTYSWVLKGKIEEYEKLKKDNIVEMMERIIVPSMLVILVIILIIFLPKIIDKMREPALRLLDKKLDTWFTTVRGTPPP